MKRASLILVFCVFLQGKCGADNGGSDGQVDLNNNNSNNGSSKSDDTDIEESRKKEKSDMMEKILPMLAMPFMTQLSLAPMMIMSMKFMLMKSAFLGKLAIVFGLLTFLNNLLKNPGGLYSHNINIPHPPEHQDFHPHHEHGYKRRTASIQKPYIYTRKKMKRSTFGCSKC